MLGITLHYLHRDDGNYKLFGSVDFTNIKNLPIDEIVIRLRNKLIDGEYFYPKDFGIQKFIELEPEIMENWYEVEKIEEIEFFNQTIGLIDISELFD